MTNSFMGLKAIEILNEYDNYPKVGKAYVKISVILGHPKKGSFNHTIADSAHQQFADPSIPSEEGIYCAVPEGAYICFDEKQQVGFVDPCIELRLDHNCDSYRK